MHQIIQSLSDWYNHALQTGGYPAVALMMAVESSLFPLPSEIVIPPAAHWAHTGQIPLTLWGIVLAGTIGSWLGATVMYWASRLAGRPLVLHFGKYFFISAEKVAGAERWSAH
jgi:membrane protein DedA with SNARE-associated domain